MNRYAIISVLFSGFYAAGAVSPGLAHAYVAGGASSAELSKPTQRGSGVAKQASDGRRPRRPPTERSIGAYLGLEWRLLGLGGHVGHGPGFQAGIILWKRLKLGIGLISHPGSINPATFTVQLAEGVTYRGRSSLELRNDGTFIGAVISPVIAIPRVPWLSLEVPIMIGVPAFGFFLSGDDRKTPDGRRVSDWENQLFDGRDSDTSSFGLDVGLRANFVLPRHPFLRPYFGLHYTVVTGFDTVVMQSPDYDGLSGVVGLQVGWF